jgi:hypothetical protein
MCEKIVHISLAVEIEPEKDRAYVAVGQSWKGAGKGLSLTSQVVRFY